VSRRIDRHALTEANVWSIRDMSQSFAEFGAWHAASFTLTGNGAPIRADGAAVTVGFFRSLGVTPVDSAEVFVPLVRRADPNRGSWEYDAVARLKDGMSMAAASADMDRVMRMLTFEWPEDNEGQGIALAPSLEWIGGESLRRTLSLLLGAVSLLVRGRGFTDRDRVDASKGATVPMIVSQRLASRLWPNENPVGRQAVLWAGQGGQPGVVLGVVQDMREERIEEAPTMAVYFPAHSD
jgi:hypothetical protein